MEHLKPDEWVSIPFQAPNSSRDVEITIDADQPVNVRVLTEDGLNEFLNDEADAYAYYVERLGVRTATLRFTPEKGERWILFLENESAHIAHVSYDVRW